MNNFLLNLFIGFAIFFIGCNLSSSNGQNNYNEPKDFHSAFEYAICNQPFINNPFAIYSFAYPWLAILDLPVIMGKPKRQIRLVSLNRGNEISWNNITLKEGFEYKSLITISTSYKNISILTTEYIVYDIDTLGEIVKTIDLQRPNGYQIYPNTFLRTFNGQYAITVKSEECHYKGDSSLDCFAVVLYDKNGKINGIYNIEESRGESTLNMFADKIYLYLDNTTLIVVNAYNHKILIVDLKMKHASYLKIDGKDMWEQESRILSILKQSNILNVLIVNEIDRSLKDYRINLEKKGIEIKQFNYIENIVWASLLDNAYCTVDQMDTCQYLEIRRLMDADKFN